MKSSQFKKVCATPFLTFSAMFKFLGLSFIIGYGIANFGKPEYFLFIGVPLMFVGMFLEDRSPNQGD